MVVLEGGGGGFCTGVVLVGSGVQQKWSRTLLLWCRRAFLVNRSRMLGGAGVC